MNKQRQNIYKWTPLIAVIFLMIACSTADILESLATETPAEFIVVTPTPQQDLIKSDLLYSDDFSDMNSGWDAPDNETSRYFYSEGEYFIEANNDNSNHIIINEKNYEAGVFNIALRHISGDENLTAGMILWRYQNNDNYFALTISGNGQYSIHRFLHGNYGLITLPISTPLLKTGGESNKISVAFHGAISEIYFNDQFVYSYNDPSLQGGNIGLGVSPDKSSAVKIAFDDLSIYKYDPGNLYTPVRPQPTPTPEYRNISWSELVQFLADDHTNWHEYDLETYNCVDYAVDLATAADRQNIKARLVRVDFVDQETGHAFVEFETSDHGLIFVEPQGDNTYTNVKIGNKLCDDWGQFECMGVISNIEYKGACDHQHNCTIYLPLE